MEIKISPNGFFLYNKLLNKKYMAINLRKGQRIDIGLNNLTIGLGWDPNEGTGFDFDLDASAFMINHKHLIPKEEFFIFYGNIDSPDRALHPYR